MKTLYVLRHAKSDWNTGAGDDHSRPLAPRGERAAALVGRWLASLDEVPDRIVSSTAERAATTAERVLDASGTDAELVRDPDLYGAPPERLLAAVAATPDSAESVMIVAHEPGISAFVGRMIGGAAVRYPTAALTRIDLACRSWRDADFGAGQLRWMVVPRALEAFEG